MATTRRCLRCGHEWSLRTGTEPKTCPKCRSPYWNRQRRDEQMAQVIEMERAAEARRRDEMERLKRKHMLMDERERIRSDHRRMRSELETLHRQTEDLDKTPERKPLTESELQKMKVRAERIHEGLSSSESKLDQIERELADLDTIKTEGESTSIDRDTLLEALGDDAENELYAAGAREYARRLADRVRNGEFNGD